MVFPMYGPLVLSWVKNKRDDRPINMHKDIAAKTVATLNLRCFKALNGPTSTRTRNEKAKPAYAVLLSLATR